VVDVLRLLALGVRSRSHLAAENLFLRKQLAFYNLTNANPIQNTSWSSGSSFLRPLAIVPPRVWRVGAKFDW